MTGTEIESIISKLAETLGTSAQQLVEIYAPWVLASAWIFLGVGVFLLIVGLIAGVVLFSSANSQDDRGWAVIISVLIIFIASLFVGANIPDIAAPKAAAINKILDNVKPSE